MGQVLHAASARLDTAKTRPPPYYTEPTLLDDMTGAHKFAKDESDRALLKQVAGIGTSRTRDVIIKNLIAREFMVRVKRGKEDQLHITPAGQALLDGLPAMLKDVAMTAKWERALGLVAEGKAQPEQLLTKIQDVLRKTVPEVLSKA